MKLEKVVKVEWVDSISSSSWEGIKSAKEIRPADVVSYGYLLDAGDDYITLAQNYIGNDEQEQVCNTISITRCSVKSVQDITDYNYNDPSKAVNPNR